jgi:hypothetical protein
MYILGNLLNISHLYAHIHIHTCTEYQHIHTHMYSPTHTHTHTHTVAVEPEDASALHVLGNLLLDVHNDDVGAEKMLRKAKLVSPVDPSISCDYGRLLQAQVLKLMVTLSD